MAYKVNFLVVEDNANERSSIVEDLNEMFNSNENYEVGIINEASNEAQAMDIISKNFIDILILDNNIPEKPGKVARYRGQEIIKQLRDTGNNLPVLVITGLEDIAPEGSREANIMGKALVDFIQKPYNPEVMISRVKSLMVNYHKAGGQVRIGQWNFCPSREILDPADGNGSRVYLSPILSRFLNYLYLNRNREMSLQDIYQDVWGFNDPTGGHTIQTHIYRLRNVLEDKDHELIKTVSNGYKLVL
ncbi:MAG: response regulator transcription factor [Rhodobacteraceae bacterium]|nr:response regulator transcription factor [Paracoccaceae bacterium]